MGPDRVPAHFVFEFMSVRGVRILPPRNCESMSFQLVRYEPDGLVTTLGREDQLCQPVLHAALPPGQYGLLVSGAPRNGHFTAEFIPFEAEFGVPGSLDREAMDNELFGFFQVREARRYTIEISRAGNARASCNGDALAFVMDMEGELIADILNTNRCGPLLSTRWTGELPAGTYLLRAFADWLTGTYTIDVDLPLAEPQPDPGHIINGVGVWPFQGFGAGDRVLLEMEFPAARRYTVTTAGPDGVGCPGDTFMRILRNGAMMVQNDDSPDAAGNCSSVEVNANAAERYQVEISGFRGIGIGVGTIVVTH
jgi:hypothetical protein